MLEYLTLRRFEVNSDLIFGAESTGCRVMFCQQVFRDGSVDYRAVDEALSNMYFRSEYDHYMSSRQEHQLEALFENLAVLGAIPKKARFFWVARIDSPIFADYQLSVPGSMAPYSIRGFGDIVGRRSSYGMDATYRGAFNEAFTDIAERMEEGFEDTHPEIAATIGRFRALAESIGVHPASLPPNAGGPPGVPQEPAVLN